MLCHAFSIGEFQNFCRAIGNTLRIAPAKIAFRGHPVWHIESNSTYRTGIDTHGTADTDISVDDHHIIWMRAMQSTRRAYIHAG